MPEPKTRRPQGRPRAETPKGFRDLFGAEVAAREEMLARIAAVYRLHGFEPLETSAVETVEALGKFLPDVDRPNEGVFAWQEEPEQDGDWLALRYDLTAPLARVFAQHRASLPTPYRRYAMGPVWRNEKPGPGRFRQFYQCDADTVGTPTVAADAEIVGMLAEALEAVGIERGDYLIKINNRKILNGVLESAGVLDPKNPDLFATERGIVLRAIDKFDRLGGAGVEALLGRGRRDESGDFTQGAGLSTLQIERILGFVLAKVGVDIDLERQARTSAKIGGSTEVLRSAQSDIFDFLGYEARSSQAALVRNQETLRVLGDLVGSSAEGQRGVEELQQIAELTDTNDLMPSRFEIDPSTVRGLGYYTGPVFEAELTFSIRGEDGLPRRFGSVAGGGRYDDLVRRFTGESVPATGVSIGVDRLLTALQATKRVEAEAQGPVVVTVMDRDRLADSMALAAELRRAGIRAEAYLGNPKSFGAQLKYADRRRAPFAIIEGSDERARGVVQVKDLVAGALAAETASLEEWKGRPAQAEVPRAELAAHLKRLLR